MFDSAGQIVEPAEALQRAKELQRKADENWQRIWEKYQREYPQREPPQVLEGNPEWKR